LYRWPLLSVDRLPGNRPIMTQVFIANMLGVRILVVDGPKLSKMSCECYAVVKKEPDRLLPEFTLYKAACGSRRSHSVHSQSA
jgi:hypothetical protein